MMVKQRRYCYSEKVSRQCTRKSIRLHQPGFHRRIFQQNGNHLHKPLCSLVPQSKKNTLKSRHKCCCWENSEHSNRIACKQLFDSRASHLYNQRCSNKGLRLAKSQDCIGCRTCLLCQLYSCWDKRSNRKSFNEIWWDLCRNRSDKCSG